MLITNNNGLTPCSMPRQGIGHNSTFSTAFETQVLKRCSGVVGKLNDTKFCCSRLVSGEAVISDSKHVLNLSAGDTLEIDKTGFAILKI